MRTQIIDLEKFIEFLKGKNRSIFLEFLFYFTFLADSANATAVASDKKSLEPLKSSPNKSNPVRFVYFSFSFSKYLFLDNSKSIKNASNSN